MPARPKRVKIEDRAYLDWVRTQRCVIWDRFGEDVDPAHLRWGTTTGTDGEDDCHVLPLSNALHRRQHDMGEVRFWREHIPAWLLMDALRAYAKAQYLRWRDGA